MQSKTDQDIPEELPSEYFEALGRPDPTSWGPIQRYRFRVVQKHLADGSVLDIGSYFGDFLLLLDDHREKYGTEINKQRVALSNEQFEDDIVKQGFRNGNLAKFGDGSVTNVVCMEVLEHVPDYKYALRELCRVASDRVLLTVPYKQDISIKPCIHCQKPDPQMGHFHSFDETTVPTACPDSWQVSFQQDFAKQLIRVVSRTVPPSVLPDSLLIHIDPYLPGDGKWLLVQLEAE